MDTVFAPFVFSTAKVVDQRCNYLDPLHGLAWEVAGAVLSSTLFAYSLEINGSPSMGAGALEAPTTKLRRYPVFDPRTLTASEKTKLIKLAEAVWEAEAPVNWEADGTSPGPKLRALDAWLLDLTKTGIELDQLYTDLGAACQSRITVARIKPRPKRSIGPRASPA
jgi:hypothetical protein